MDDSVTVIHWQLTCTCFPFQLLPNPLHKNGAPAPDIHLHHLTFLIRADLTELRSNKAHISPSMQHALSTSTDVSLLEHNSAKSARIKKVESWKCSTEAGASFPSSGLGKSWEWKKCMLAANV
ncbi:predicted protein [Lichtheimia corymbifera JMRC:FSU:9682]|uniref:Uncharacterized protein n=1 Tax=Lichtheimia corymbifera JMRC:FSU:9682 TaxID=1263082 RepID=A0A068RG22_9FUNG|nr:predicted protein [Lichtheimia corymbifera JMRC:FSU:9682]